MEKPDMNGWSAKIGTGIIKYRWLIILANIAVLIGLFFAMINRGKKFGEHVAYMREIRNNPMAEDTNHVSPPPIFNADYHVFFEDDNRDMVEYDEFQRIFAKEDNLVIVIKAKDGNLFTNENLASLKEITDKGWSIPYVNRVDGITNFNYTTVDGDELLVDDFIAELPYSDSLLGYKKHLALTDSLMPKFLISKDADLTQVTLKVVAPPEFEEALHEADMGARRLTDEVMTGYAGLKGNLILQSILLSKEGLALDKSRMAVRKRLSKRTKAEIIEALESGKTTLEELYNNPLFGTIREINEWVLAENKMDELKEKVHQVVRENQDKSFPEIVAAVGSALPGEKMPEDLEILQAQNPELALSPNPNLEIRLGGTVMLNNAFREYAQRDMTTLIPMMYLVIMVFLLVTLRSFWGVVTPMVLLFTSIIFPIFLFVGVFERYLTNVSMNVMQMLVAVAIADAVHILTIFFRGLRSGMTKREAVILTIDKNFLPCLITSITTSIGFFSLIFQNIPPFKDLGLFAGAGCLYAFVASVFTLTAFLTLLPYRPKKQKEGVDKTKPSPFYVSLSRWVVANQKPVRIVALILTAASIYFMTTITVDSTAVKYFSPETEFRKASEYIDANIIGTNALEFSFKSGEENGVYNPEFLKKIERFTEYVNSHPEYEITFVSSIVDVVKRLNQTMHGNDPAFYTIPDKDSVVEDGSVLRARNLIAQYMFLYTMSLPQGMEITNQVNLDNSQARVVAFIRSVSSGQQIEVTNTLNEWLEKEMPEVGARGLGVPVMFGKLMEVAIPGMLVSLAISLVFITLVLMITFRSVRIGLFSMIPNVWPIFIIFGAVGLVGYTVNLSVAVVGMITLGICVDDTVHFLVKYLRAVKQGKHGEAAFTQAFHEVASPLIFTSIILVFGFGALLFSDFALNSDMGMLCSAVIALALFADFVLLPATILKFHKEEVETK